MHRTVVNEYLQRFTTLMEVAGGIIVAVLFVYALVRQVMENLTIDCPQCGQRIKQKAIICPFCRHQFRGPRVEDSQ